MKTPDPQRASTPEASADTSKAGPWIPERVKTALEASNSDQLRKKRLLRYLHMFSGEEDQLAKSLKAEATRARLEIYVESLDRKRDSELNLASHLVYDEIEKSSTNG